MLRDGLRVVVSADGHGPAKRLADVFDEHGLPTAFAETADPDGVGARVEVVPSPLRQGFRSEELDLAVLGTWDVFGPRRRRSTKRVGNRTTAADAVLQLEVGDPVVHRTHGVGTYRGMITREFPGEKGRTAHRDYVVLEYAGEDALYVPSDQVDAISRYQGGEKPSVMSLGGSQWEKAKSRVRKAVRDIAAELIRLYAARMHSPGHAFAPDGTMQTELEDAFAHVETQDQLTVADEIKRDMEAPLPMDRLLAGDVGFGKTEVAVRAAAKAVFDGKQVAVLVPTTILAQQHSETFRERFAGFPVNVAVVSRFVPDKDKRAVLDGLAAGTVDIVIGTHSLLGKDVIWKDLGLIIVDEEQRFGVQQKERLKQLRTSVDVLSMSATPIPRTLEMAVSGIRDLVVIETAPEDRQPVLTVVQEYDEAQIALAIRRELLRDGQIFYLHNKVETIHADRGQAAGARPRRSRRGGARADGREAARARDGAVLGARVRRARRHHDHRGGARHPERQHPHHRAGRRARAVPAPPATRACRPLLANAGTPTSCSPRAGRSPSPPTSGSRPSPNTPGSAAGWPSRCATSRSAAPATSSAPSSPARSPRSGSTCTRSCSRRRSPTSPASRSRWRSTSSSSSPSTPTSRTTTSRTRPSGSSSTSASRPSATPRGSRTSAPSCVDRFGTPPEPAERLLTLTALKAALRRWKVHRGRGHARGRCAHRSCGSHRCR